jgi:hypothetical protein
MSNVRIPAAAGAALATVVLLTGCQSSTKTDPPAAAPTQAAPTSAAPATAAAPSASGAPSGAASGGSAGSGAVTTGTALKAKLPTAATLPSGWSLQGSDGYEFDTKDTIMSPGKPLLPGSKCTELTNSGAGSLSIDYRAAYAEIKVRDAKKADVDVVIAAYHPGDAAKLLGEIKTLTDGCKTYQADALGGAKVQMAVSNAPVSGLGEESLDVKSVPQGHYVSQETLIARVGDTVVLLSGSDAGSGSLPDLQPLAAQLVKSLK